MDDLSLGSFLEELHELLTPSRGPALPRARDKSPNYHIGRSSGRERSQFSRNRSLSDTPVAPSAAHYTAPQSLPSPPHPPLAVQTYRTRQKYSTACANVFLISASLNNTEEAFGWRGKQKDAFQHERAGVLCLDPVRKGGQGRCSVDERV